MSLDFCTGELVRRGIATTTATINASKTTGAAVTTTYELLVPEGTYPNYFGSKFQWRVLAAQVRIITARNVALADTVTHTFKVQKSDSLNAFATPVDICSVSIGNGATYPATTLIVGRGNTGTSVGDDLDVPADRLCRAVHCTVGNSASESLIYEYEVFGTTRHE